MTITFPDDILNDANLDARTLAIDFACHLFNTQRVTISQARRLVGLSRGEFEDELHDRRIPAYRYTLEMFQEDMETNKALRQEP